jgi:hypothetical protein
MVVSVATMYGSAAEAPPSIASVISAPEECDVA